MLSKIKSCTLLGIEAIPIDVEVDAKRGMPGEYIVGLPDTVVRESKTRIKAALKNSGFEYPVKQYTINLAPADLPKEGAYFDLAIALGMLSVNQYVSFTDDCVVVGELSLDGSLKPVKGILSICDMIAKSNCKKLILPKDNLDEAAMISSIELFPISHLKELMTLDLNSPKQYTSNLERENGYKQGDYSEVKGQDFAKKALQIAAAGRHNCLLIGPPGSGKSMLIKRLPSILPELSDEQAIETHKLYSITTSHRGKTLSKAAPFRQPHHSISYAGLVGGGSKPIPGEISLAHNGILFLDELPEFNRQVLEVMRQPLESGDIVISRASQSVQFPANFMLLAAMNPCPCGYYGDSSQKCHCSDTNMQRYIKKISGPILDRIDIVIEVPRLKKDDFKQDESKVNSAIMKKRVLDCIKIQHKRHNKCIRNAELSPKEVMTHIQLNAQQKHFLGSCVEKGILTGRSYDKVIKIARTIADIEGSASINDQHLSEAIQFRRHSLHQGL